MSGPRVAGGAMAGLVLAGVLALWAAGATGGPAGGVTCRPCPVSGQHAVAQTDRQAVTVTMESTADAVDLGETVDLTIAVTNSSTEPIVDVVAHLDITSFETDGSVDPEDWTPTLSKPVGRLDPGTTSTVTWTVQPISPGTFELYAVALAPEARSVPSSRLASLTVRDRRSLNPEGILPVALAVPAGLGLLLVARLRADRRR